MNQLSFFSDLERDFHALLAETTSSWKSSLSQSTTKTQIQQSLKVLHDAKKSYEAGAAPVPGNYNVGTTATTKNLLPRGFSDAIVQTLVKCCEGSPKLIEGSLRISLKLVEFQGGVCFDSNEETLVVLINMLREQAVAHGNSVEGIATGILQVLQRIAHVKLWLGNELVVEQVLLVFSVLLEFTAEKFMKRPGEWLEEMDSGIVFGTSRFRDNLKPRLPSTAPPQIRLLYLLAQDACVMADNAQNLVGRGGNTTTLSATKETSVKSVADQFYQQSTNCGYWLCNVRWPRQLCIDILQAAFLPAFVEKLHRVKNVLYGDGVIATLLFTVIATLYEAMVNSVADVAARKMIPFRFSTQQKLCPSGLSSGGSGSRESTTTGQRSQPQQNHLNELQSQILNCLTTIWPGLVQGLAALLSSRNTYDERLVALHNFAVKDQWLKIERAAALAEKHMIGAVQSSSAAGGAGGSASTSSTASATASTSTGAPTTVVLGGQTATSLIGSFVLILGLRRAPEASKSCALLDPVTDGV
eukprot:g8392.t1